MDLENVLWIYLILIFALFVFFYKQKFNFLEALIISLVIGLIFLFIAYPPSELDLETENLSCSALYILILGLTIAIILIYTLYVAWTRRITK